MWALSRRRIVQYFETFEADEQLAAVAFGRAARLARRAAP